MGQVSNLDILISATVDPFIDNLNRAKAEMKSFTEAAPDIGKLGTAFSVLSVAIVALGTAAIWAASKTDELTQALQNMGGQGTRQFEQFAQDANHLGLGIDAVAKSAIKLEASGISNETTRKLIDGVGEAVRKMGGGDAQFKTVIDGLQMIASTGTLTNRSLRTIIKTAPEMEGAFMSAFGTDNTKKILAMGLSVDDFMRKVADASAKITPHVRTMQDAFTELKNTTETSLGTLGNTLAADLGLVGALDDISNALKGAIDWFKNLPGPIRVTIEVITGVVAVLGPMLLLIQGFIMVAPILGAAWAIAMGPVGWVIAALTALIIILIEVVKVWFYKTDL